MNDRQLNFFIITAEEKSLGRAAKRLPISLSALSRQIQSLEEELDTLLFTRAASGLELTPAGDALLRHARTLRAQFSLVKNEVHRAGTALLGQLDVGGFGSAMLNHIPQIIKRFRDAYPSVNVALLTAPEPPLIFGLARYTKTPPTGASTASTSAVSVPPKRKASWLTRRS